MKAREQLIIKPYKDYFWAWVAVFICLYLFGCAICAIVSVIAPNNQSVPWGGAAIVFVIYSAAVCLIAGIGCLCYRDKLIVTEEEIVKMHGVRVYFRIKKGDIQFIGYRKVGKIFGHENT